MDDVRHDREDVPAGRGRRPVSPHLDTETLSLYLDNALEADDRAQASHHLDACPDCRGELAQLRVTVDLLHGLPQYRPRRSFQLGPRYAPPPRRSWAERLLPALPALRVATAVVALLLVMVTAGDLIANRDDEEVTEPAAVNIALPARESGEPGTEGDEAASFLVEEAAPQGPAAESEAGERAVGEIAPAADAAADAESPPAGDGDGLTAWRVAQVVLAMVLAVLVVGLVVVPRVGRPGGAGG